MSGGSKLKSKWHYETNVSRCETCIHYKKPGYYLRNSLPIHYGASCQKGGFTCKPTAICDKWENKHGDTLEPYENRN